MCWERETLPPSVRSSKWTLKGGAQIALHNHFNLKMLKYDTIYKIHTHLYLYHTRLSFCLSSVCLYLIINIILRRYIVLYYTDIIIIISIYLSIYLSICLSVSLFSWTDKYKFYKFYHIIYIYMFIYIYIYMFMSFCLCLLSWIDK